MDNSLKEKIKTFILTGVDEQPICANPDPFWQSLKKVGTELWLDTGDIVEAEKIWTDEMTALTTNNTLVNKEIQKGIYDDFIAEAKEIVRPLPIEQQIVEIAFILNARHGLRLAKKFGGFVSVELHTGIAHNIDATIDYGTRYFEICPEQFIVKVPYTASGLIGARKLREKGVRINLTLEFSARQNVLVAKVAKPNYTNVFLGRIGAYFKDNNLGEGSGIGEMTVLESQIYLNEIAEKREEKTKLIAASMRHFNQLDLLAGVDVFTMPIKVADDGKYSLKGNFFSRLSEKYSLGIEGQPLEYYPEKLFEVTDKEMRLAEELGDNCPETGNELIDIAHKFNCGDMFPYLRNGDLQHISQDGKIPKHDRWAKRISEGELAVDTLLNLAGLASFANDQTKLDERIKSIII